MIDLADRLGDARVVAIVRRPDVGEIGFALARRLVAAGVTALEFTLDQPHAIEVIERVRAEVPDGVVVGGGTVTTPDQVDALVAAGADFGVAPGFDPAVVARAQQRRLGFLPGVATPSEVGAALRMGVETLKLFPAGPLGVDYLTSLAKPFPDARFVPTGGIGLGDVDIWLRAGALCVGIGGALTDPATTDADLAAALERLGR